jgi:hypothetical protein
LPNDAGWIILQTAGGPDAAGVSIDRSIHVAVGREALKAAVTLLEHQLPVNWRERRLE